MSERMTFNGTCRLCLKHGPLVNSHIIPKFHWKQLKISEGHFFVVTNDSKKKERKEQKEVTERLLCTQCDTVVLQKYEDHLARVLFGGKELQFQNNGRTFCVSGFDYRKIKNGLLSILWRMSLSSHAYFKEVNLGEKHVERIRLALLNNEVLPELEYPIHFCIPRFSGKHHTSWIVPPDFTRADGNRVYRCLI
jgi:hypothetical protein